MGRKSTQPNYCLEHYPTPQSVLLGDTFINLSAIHRVTGIGVSHLSLIFSGRREPSLKTCIKLSKALGMGLDVFVATLTKSIEMRLLYDRLLSEQLETKPEIVVDS